MHWRIFAVQVIQLECLKITDKNVPRQLRFLDTRKIVQGLLFSLCDLSAGALLFDEQHSFPEEIDKSVLTIQFLDRLFKARNTPARYTEYLEKFIVKSLGLAFFIARVLPLIREVGSSRANFIPR